MALAHVWLPPAKPPVRADGHDWHPVVIGLAANLNEVTRGNIVATAQITLVANDVTSTFNDTRIGPFSYLGLMPTTASAREALPHIYIQPGKMTATIHHAMSPATDMTFIVVIIGGS